MSDSGEEVDGRKRRTLRNRDRVIEAALRLAERGNPMPSADELAAAAGIGRRSLFRLFGDMDGVFAEIHARLRARLHPPLATSLDEPDPRRRVELMVERRTRLFEELLPYMKASDMRARSPFLRAERAWVDTQLRTMLELQLADWLKAEPWRIDALDAMLSLDMWQRMRHAQGMSARKSADIMLRSALALAAF